MSSPMRTILRYDLSCKHEKGRICDYGRRSWKIQGVCDVQKEEEGSKSSRALYLHGALNGCGAIQPY